MVAVAATLFAVNGTVSKVILGSGIDAGQLTEVRCAGALLGLTLIALATRPSSLRLRRTELPLIVALGVGGLALVQWSYFFAIHRVAIGIALVIQFVGRSSSRCGHASSTASRSARASGSRWRSRWRGCC
jgi:threonine/homoserine efflux transporter RhtA